MSKKVCLICLTCEATTRLFSMQAAYNEDERRYEALTGIKLKCPAFICQRCSIDLGLAVNLKQKALEAAKCLAPSISKNPYHEFKVPALKSSMMTHSQIPPNRLTITPITQTTLNYIEKPANQNSSPSSKTALSSTGTMSRTDKIMSSASIISSTIVDPPLDMSKISNLFNTNPNVSLIKTKLPEDKSVNANKTIQEPPKEKFPGEGEKKVQVNQSNRITKRRQTVCAENFYKMQQQPDSQTGKKVGSFQPAIVPSSGPKRVIKVEVDKKFVAKASASKQKIEDEKKTAQKRQNDESINTNGARKMQKTESPGTQGGQNAKVQNGYNMRTRAIKSPEQPTLQYWIKSSKGCYIESFKNMNEANKFFDELPKGSSYTPLSDD